MVSSRARWAKTERKTKNSFLIWKKETMIKKSHYKLNSGKGFIISDQKAILSKLVDYYKHLYSGSNCTKSQINDLNKNAIEAELPKLTKVDL